MGIITWGPHFFAQMKERIDSKMATPEKTNDAVFDASTLGTSKMLILGLQHMFAMFGATVLVPAITGLNVSTTLFFAGLGTLLFHLITGRKVPAFLGSSFAFLGAYGLVTNSDQSASCCPSRMTTIEPHSLKSRRR